MAEVFAEMGNQNFILMKDEEMVTAEDSEEEMPRLWHELSVLEQRTEPQRESVHIVRAEMIEDERVHSYELEQKGILAEDGIEERLTNSLRKCLKNWNQHSDVMIEEKRKLG